MHLSVLPQGIAGGSRFQKMERRTSHGMPGKGLLGLKKLQEGLWSIGEGPGGGCWWLVIHCHVVGWLGNERLRSCRLTQWTTHHGAWLSTHAQSKQVDERGLAHGDMVWKIGGLAPKGAPRLRSEKKKFFLSGSQVGGQFDVVHHLGKGEAHVMAVGGFDG